MQVMKNNKIRLRSYRISKEHSIVFLAIEVEISGNVLMARLRKLFTAENGKFIAGFLV